MKRAEAQHPIINTVQTFIKKKRLLRRNDTIIAAVSGGVDSVVMLHLLVTLQRMWGWKIVVAHCNFQLRGKESNNDETFVGTTAKRYGLPFYTQQCETKKIAAHSKRSVQEAAREIRYSFFENLKRSLKADAIITAHHADDNAETMLINLFRGSGIDGVAGIPVKRDSIIRPLLTLSRKEIAAYAKLNDLKFREDSSNASNDYTRNFLRNKIIPAIQKRINPSLNETLLTESELFRSLADFLNVETEKAYKRAVRSDQIYSTILSEYHPIVQQSVILRSLKDLNIEPKSSTVFSIMELLENQKGSIVEIQQEWIAERLAESIVFRKQESISSFEYRLKREGKIKTDNFTVSVKKSALPDNKRRTDASKEYVDASLLEFPLIIRTWKAGDFFIPLGMKGRKKLSDFFGEQKFSTTKKINTPVVVSNGNIVWVAGKRLDERYKITNSTTETYKLTIEFHAKKNHHR